MIVFDEKKYVEENILKRPTVLINRAKSELIMLGRYLVLNDYSDDNIINILKDKSRDTLLEFKMLRDKDFVKNIMSKIHQRSLIYDVKINITECELEKIKNINNHRTERVMFVLLVIQKFFNSEYIKTNVNEMQKMCKLNYNTDYFKKYILRKLVDMGYINIYSPRLYKVNIRDDDSLIVITIDDFDDLIGYYLATCNTKDYIYCRRCGKKVARTNNRQKYCKQCSIETNREKTLKNKQKV